MQNNFSMGFIGGGRVTSFLLEGLKRTETLSDKIIVSDPNQERQQIFESIDSGKIEFTQENSEATKSQIVFLAVHPPLIKEVLPQIQNNLSSESILISLAPVVKMSALQQFSGGFDRIVRMIPNAPSIIGAGYNPAWFSDSISSQEKDALLALFGHWGKTPEVPENTLEAYAILTAMGPTYFWFQWLELQKLGEKFDLKDIDIRSALHEMILGSSELLFNSEYSTEQVLDMIPVLPLHEDENDIRLIINTRLSALYGKLTAKR